MAKLAYRPLGMLVSVLGGLIASRLFTTVWKAVDGGEDAPESTDARRSWSEVLIAAALQGAIFATVKAATDRSGAIGFEKMTGAWPGKE